MLLYSFGLLAQPVSSLEQYLQAVQQQAWQAKIAGSENLRAQAAYRLFTTSLRPQVMLQAFAPVFTRTSSSVVQPNGSIFFQPLFQNNASLSVSVQQPLPFTGGTLFVETILDRFDDFGQKVTLYNGIPLRLGYRQSLVGFNPWKWDKKIEKQRLELSKTQYGQDMAAINVAAVNLYFEALLAMANLGIADSNRLVNEKLLLIAEERLQLGKISEDEKLQMEAEYRQSVIQLAQAKSIWQQAVYGMANMLPGIKEVSKQLATPKVFELSIPEAESLQAMAMAQSPAVRSVALQLLSERRSAAQVKSEMSPTFEILSTIGLANSGGKLNEVYRQPFVEQQLRVGITVPLVDWGRKKAAVQQAGYRIERAEAETNRQKDAIGNEVRQLHVHLHELKDRLQAQFALIDISEKRYKISTERYAAGAVLLTELVLAQRNKDQAIRDYLASLQQYYVAWHTLNGLIGGNLAMK